MTDVFSFPQQLVSLQFDFVSVSIEHWRIVFPFQCQAVRKDNKQRFSLLDENGELLIRANQGHTVTVIFYLYRPSNMLLPFSKYNKADWLKICWLLHLSQMHLMLSNIDLYMEWKIHFILFAIVSVFCCNPLAL